MMLWGSAIDASKAVKFELPAAEVDDHELEPHPTATAEDDKTKQHPKPTDFLDTDHAALPGETTKPAFPNAKPVPTGPSNGESTEMPNAPDEGTFTHMYDLLSSQTWLFAAFGLVALFGIGAGVYFWRRRRQRLQKRSAYAALSGGDEIGMTDRDSAGRSLLGRPGRRAGGTRELYDAFGVLSDEEEDDHDDHPRRRHGDDDEDTLQGAGGYDIDSRGVQYHAEFLDDDGPPTAGTPAGPYRDNPEPTSVRRGDSPGGSGDESWQDASEGVPKP